MTDEESSEKDCTWINEALSKMLESEKKSSYKELIQAMIDSPSYSGKYGLYILFMESGTNEIEIENLKNRLEHIYCEDKTLDEYIDSIVMFNPKFNSVELTTSSRQDMRNDYSCSISVDNPEHNKDMDVWFKNVHASEKKLKEYLKVILTEAKKIR